MISRAVLQGTLVAHGDTLDVQTLLPIADYYPGGRQSVLPPPALSSLPLSPSIVLLFSSSLCVSL
eukprot:1831923-Rhodomonas_salina.2